MTSNPGVPEVSQPVRQDDLDWIRDAYIDLSRRATTLDELIRRTGHTTCTCKQVCIDGDIWRAVAVIAATPRPQ